MGVDLTMFAVDETVSPWRTCDHTSFERIYGAIRRLDDYNTVHGTKVPHPVLLRWPSESDEKDIEEITTDETAWGPPLRFLPVSELRQLKFDDIEHGEYFARTLSEFLEGKSDNTKILLYWH